MKDERFTKLYEMAKKEVLEDILPFWMRYDVDEENGGFYGVVTREGKPVKEGTKCLVLNARLVWTFASAYRIFRDEKYLQLARRAYDYFCEYFLDKECGGCYFMLDCKGTPVDDKKFVYGQAFAIYALSEYCRATGDTTARDRAVAIRDLLEAHAYDAEHDGYVEILTRDWTYNPEGQGSNINPEGESTRTMNTHLHLIEAYTGLLRVLRTEEQINLTRRHLAIMLDKVYDPSIHHFKMFFRDDWSATSPEISYGHDIEGTWLMMETAEVLGEPEAMRYAQDTCMNIARACYEQGFREDGAMLSEYDPVTGHASQRLSWWEQNEAVVGFLNAWEVTGEEKYLDASLQCFDFADKHFVDHEKGGWFAVLSLDGTQVLSKQKANGPTCPYHNGRMCMEIIERYRRHAAAEGAKAE